MIKISHSSQDKKDGTFTLYFETRFSYYQIVNILKELPYKKKDRSYKFSIEDINNLLDLLSELKTETVHVELGIFDYYKESKKIVADIVELRNTLDGIDCGIQLANGYSLLPFQHVGVEFVKRVRNCIIADKVGLGKTIQSFSSMLALHKENIIEKAIIVVPSSLKQKWKNDILDKGGHPSTIYEGAPEKRKKLFYDWLESDVLFLITSYDTLRLDWSNFIKSEELFTVPYAIVFDEVQKLKNKETSRSKSCKEITESANCVAKIGLSATYIETGLQDMFGAMYIIDPKVFGESYMHFVFKYLETNFVGKIVGATPEGKKLARIKMKTKSIRRRKPDVADQLKAFLPKVNESTMWLDLTKEQKILYNQTLKGVSDCINDMVKKNQVRMVTALTQLGLLQQVCLSTEMFSYGSKNSSAKIDCLLDILPDIIEENKVVIFCRFTKFIDIMERELKANKIPCIAIHGKRKEGAQNNRQNVIDTFSKSKSINVLVTSDILAEGVDIPAASYVINSDILWNPAKMTQRAGRIDRLNQKANNIYVINLMSNSPIEEYMHEMVKSRYDIALDVMDDGVEESRISRMKFSDIQHMLRKIV